MSNRPLLHSGKWLIDDGWQVEFKFEIIYVTFRFIFLALYQRWGRSEWGNIQARFCRTAQSTMAVKMNALKSGRGAIQRGASLRTNR